MDGLIGRYHIRVKTRKWTNRIFFHLIDVAMVNAYILYHRQKCAKKRIEKIELPQFRRMVAEVLCSLGENPFKPKRGRPSSVTPEPVAKVSRKTFLPQDEIRYDGMNHWPEFLDRSGKKTCKQPGCKSETQMFCTKCKLNLCIGNNKTCFVDFHNK